MVKAILFIKYRFCIFSKSNYEFKPKIINFTFLTLLLCYVLITWGDID